MSRYKIICKLYVKGVLIKEVVREQCQEPTLGFGLIINAFIDLTRTPDCAMNGILLYTKDCKVKVKVYKTDEDGDGKTRLYLKKTFKSYTDYGYVE